MEKSEKSNSSSIRRRLKFKKERENLSSAGAQSISDFNSQPDQQPQVDLLGRIPIYF